MSSQRASREGQRFCGQIGQLTVNGRSTDRPGDHDASQGPLITDTAAAVRQTWIDQTRWVAIVLVVVGHAVGQMRGFRGLAVIVSNFVYIFHISVFVRLAGRSARRAETGGQTLAKIWWQRLLPSVIFQLIAFGTNLGHWRQSAKYGFYGPDFRALVLRRPGGLEVARPVVPRIAMGRSVLRDDPFASRSDPTSK